MSEYSIEQAATNDVTDLLPLMHAYCDSYEASPTDAQLLALDYWLDIAGGRPETPVGKLFKSPRLDHRG